MGDAAPRLWRGLCRPGRCAVFRLCAAPPGGGKFRSLSPPCGAGYPGPIERAAPGYAAFSRCVGRSLLLFSLFAAAVGDQRVGRTGTGLFTQCDKPPARCLAVRHLHRFSDRGARYAGKLETPACAGLHRNGAAALSGRCGTPPVRRRTLCLFVGPLYLCRGLWGSLSHSSDQLHSGASCSGLQGAGAGTG